MEVSVAAAVEEASARIDQASVVAVSEAAAVLEEVDAVAVVVLEVVVAAEAVTETTFSHSERTQPFHHPTSSCLPQTQTAIK